MKAALAFSARRATKQGMLASKTSHKRRRSSARGDASRGSASNPRAIITVAGSNKGKDRQREEDQPSWAWKRLERVIASHVFNHSLHIAVPIRAPNDVDKLIERLPASSSAYLVKVPLRLFLDPIFITSHIKQGSLIALSKGRLDHDDVICLDGSGVLHLSLTRDTYQTLGLVGQVLKQSRTSSGKGRDRLSGKAERWSECSNFRNNVSFVEHSLDLTLHPLVVRVDLLSSAFVPGKPGYERTLARFTEWDIKRCAGRSQDDAMSSWDVLFSWTGFESSRGADMHFPQRYVVNDNIKRVDTAPEVSLLNDCWIPTWSSQWATKETDGGPFAWEAWKENLEVFLEWASLSSLSAECVRTFFRSDHINSYEVRDIEKRTNGTLAYITYKGLFSSSFCCSFLASVKDWYHLSATTAFAVVSCSGFSDSPIAWRVEPTLSGRAGESAEYAANISEDESGSEYEEFRSISTNDAGPLSGSRARKKRQKKRAQRGTIDRHQIGDLVKRPGGSSYNGWQVILPTKSQLDQPEYISVENVGGCLRC